MFEKDGDSCPKKSRDEFLNFNDPPKLTFVNLKIPRRSKNNEQVSLNVSPLNNISPIVPPFPGIENTVKNIDNPVRKAVIDNITGKFKTTPKLKYYRCKECNLFLNGQSSLCAHYAGVRHAKKLKELELSYISIHDLKKNKISKLAENKFKCKLCNVKVESLVQIKSHMDGANHEKKLGVYLESKQKKFFEESIRIKNELPTHTPHQVNKFSAVKDPVQLCNNNEFIVTKTKSTGSFNCVICDLSMNSQQQYDQHINSKKHSAKISKLRLTNHESEHK